MYALPGQFIRSTAKQLRQYRVIAITLQSDEFSRHSRVYIYDVPLGYMI